MKKYNLPSLLFGFINVPIGIAVFITLSLWELPNHGKEIYATLGILIHLLIWVILKIMVKTPSIKYVWIGNLIAIATLIGTAVVVNMIIGKWEVSPWNTIGELLGAKTILDVIMSIMVSKKKTKKRVVNTNAD